LVFLLNVGDKYSRRIDYKRIIEHIIFLQKFNQGYLF
jgi:hypothetical protein